MAHSAVKPSLTLANQCERFQFALSKVSLSHFVNWTDPSEPPTEPWHCKDVLLDVHIDEKWFGKQNVNRECALAPGKKAPHRSVKRKSHIEKGDVPLCSGPATM